MSNKDDQTKPDQWINEHGRINLDVLAEGAQRNAELAAKEQRQIREREAVELAAEKSRNDEFMKKVGESVAAEKRAAVDAAIADEIAEAEAVIREKQNKLHNVKEESVTDKAWREMFGTLKGEKKND